MPSLRLMLLSMKRPVIQLSGGQTAHHQYLSARLLGRRIVRNPILILAQDHRCWALRPWFTRAVSVTNESCNRSSPGRVQFRGWTRHSGLNKPGGASPLGSLHRSPTPGTGACVRCVMQRLTLSASASSLIDGAPHGRRHTRSFAGPCCARIRSCCLDVRADSVSRFEATLFSIGSVEMYGQSQYGTVERGRSSPERRSSKTKRSPTAPSRAWPKGSSFRRVLQSAVEPAE